MYHMYHAFDLCCVAFHARALTLEACAGETFGALDTSGANAIVGTGHLYNMRVAGGAAEAWVTVNVPEQEPLVMLLSFTKGVQTFAWNFNPVVGLKGLVSLRSVGMAATPGGALYTASDSVDNGMVTVVRRKPVVDQLGLPVTSLFMEQSWHTGIKGATTVDVGTDTVTVHGEQKITEFLCSNWGGVVGGGVNVSLCQTLRFDVTLVEGSTDLLAALPFIHPNGTLEIQTKVSFLFHSNCYCFSRHCAHAISCSATMQISRVDLFT
jgi:hypothetical protein